MRFFNQIPPTIIPPITCVSRRRIGCRIIHSAHTAKKSTIRPSHANTARPMRKSKVSIIPSNLATCVNNSTEQKASCSGMFAHESRVMARNSCSRSQFSRRICASFVDNSGAAFFLAALSARIFFSSHSGLGFFIPSPVLGGSGLSSLPHDSFRHPEVSPLVPTGAHRTIGDTSPPCGQEQVRVLGSKESRTSESPKESRFPQCIPLAVAPRSFDRATNKGTFYSLRNPAIAGAQLAPYCGMRSWQGSTMETTGVRPASVATVTLYCIDDASYSGGSSFRRSSQKMVSQYPPKTIRNPSVTAIIVNTYGAKNSPSAMLTMTPRRKRAIEGEFIPPFATGQRELYV